MLRAALTASLLVATLVTAGAQSASGDDSAQANPDPVFVFNRVCYSQVPSVQAIRDMAFKLAWKSLEDEELKQFRTYEETKALDGWDAQVGEKIFRVGVNQGKAPEALTKPFDGFENATATTCTMLLDEAEEASEFLANMQRLAGKDPLSADVNEGELRTTTWAGGNEDLKVFLVAKAAASGRGGLLNVTVLQK